MKRKLPIGLAISGYKGYELLREAVDNNLVAVEVVFLYEKNNDYHNRIQQLCNNHDIETKYTIKLENHADVLRNKNISMLFVIGWRYSISKVLFSIPLIGIIVFHDSLLPRYRGFAPTFWALINGEESTGATAFFIDDGIDTGDIIYQKRIKIQKSFDINDLMPLVCNAYKNIFNKIIRDVIAGKKLPRKKQNHKNATYSIWRNSEDARINWSDSVQNIHNLMRASKKPFYPAFAFYKGKKLYILDAEISDRRKYAGSIPGKVEHITPGDGVYILAMDGILKLKKVQFEHAEEKDAWDIIDTVRARLE